MIMVPDLAAWIVLGDGCALFRAPGLRSQNGQLCSLRACMKGRMREFRWSPGHCGARQKDLSKNHLPNRAPEAPKHAPSPPGSNVSPHDLRTPVPEALRAAPGRLRSLSRPGPTALAPCARLPPSALHPRPPPPSPRPPGPGRADEDAWMKRTPLGRPPAAAYTGRASSAGPLTGFLPPTFLSRVSSRLRALSCAAWGGGAEWGGRERAQVSRPVRARTRD